MVKNDKIDALIMLSGNALVQKNIEHFKSVDTSKTVRPKSLDKRVHRNINRENRRNELGSFYKYAKRVVAAILVVFTISFAAAMSVDAVRTAIWNAIVGLFDDYVSITHVKDIAPPSTIEEKKNIDVQREDWEKHVAVDSDAVYFVFYTENGVKVVSFSQSLLEQSRPWIDNENSVVEHVEVGNNPAVLVFLIDRQIYSLSWNDETYSYLLTAYKTDITKEDLIALAETTD